MNTSSSAVPVNDNLLALLHRAERGDSQAFKEVVQAFMPGLYSAVYAITPHHEEVNDILQDTFIKVFRSLKQLRDKRAFKGWLYRIAINTANSRLRSSQQRHETMVEDDTLFQNMSTPSNHVQQLEQEELRNAVHKALGELPPEHRMVVSLVELEEMTCVEAAEVLQVPAGTVRSRLHYARKRLADILRPYRALLGQGETP